MGRNISLISAGVAADWGTSEKTAERIQMVSCSRFVIQRTTYTCPFHSDLHYLTAGGKGGGSIWMQHQDNTDTPSTAAVSLRVFSPRQTTHTYAAHSRAASACGQLHHRPRAAGSEVIMRAGSICSLTPAVSLDYRNIDRPGLTGSPYQASAESQANTETELDGDIFQITQQKQNKAMI